MRKLPLENLAPVPTSILTWLATACKATRENADVTLAQVGAAAHKDPSSIYRFEEGQTSPRDVERVVAAYATAVGVPAQLIWADALGLWGRAQQSPDGDHLRIHAGHAKPPEPSLESLAARLDDISKRLNGSEDSIAFEILFRNSHEGVAILDPELNFRRVNEAWAQMLGEGTPPRQFAGKKLGNWMGEAANHLMPLCVKALAGAPTYDERIVTDGKSWKMSIFPLDVPPVGIVIMATDTTAQERIALLLKGL